ncbi:MAG: DUF1697 domain-containing protein, partial [Solirubrobacterales bacterium]
MARFAAFLRAINVGNRKATGEQLRSAAERRGFAEVASFRNSGNLVVSAVDLEISEVAERLEHGLREELGFEVPAFVRSARQVRAIAAHEPLPAPLMGASKGKLQVILLGGKPSASAGRKALALAGEDDRLALRGSELYWLPSAGTQDSDLDQAALGEILG